MFESGKMKRIVLLFLLIFFYANDIWSFEKKVPENFEEFFIEFNIDSSFQKSRINFPFIIKQIATPDRNFDEFDTIPNLLNWHVVNLIDTCNNGIFNIIFENANIRSNQFIYKRLSINSNFFEKWYFKLIKGKWFLIKRENYAD